MVDANAHSKIMDPQLPGALTSTGDISFLEQDCSACVEIGRNGGVDCKSCARDSMRAEMRTAHEQQVQHSVDVVAWWICCRY